MAVASVATPLNELGAFSSWSNQSVILKELILPIIRFPAIFCEPSKWREISNLH